jgi:hypothetical protein
MTPNALKMFPCMKKRLDPPLFTQKLWRTLLGNICENQMKSFCWEKTQSFPFPFWISLMEGAPVPLLALFYFQFKFMRKGISLN